MDLDVHEAHIKDVQIFSDALSIELIEFLQSTLPGLAYRPSEIKEALLFGSSAELSPDLREMVADVISLIEEEFV
jgi:hypothetical protein